MKKQSGKVSPPVQPLTEVELHTIKAGWDEWGNQGETGSLGGDLFENNAGTGTAVVGAGNAGTSPEEDPWSWGTLEVPPDLNTQFADEGEDEAAAAAAAQAQADAAAAAAAQAQADADAAAAAQAQADADAAQADADAAAAAAAQAQADEDAAAAAQGQADAGAAAAADAAQAAAQAAADDAARAAASAYDAQVEADAAAQAALLAGDDDGYDDDDDGDDDDDDSDDDDDDSDDDDGYGGSIFNDYSLLSGSTAASNQSSANGFLAGSSSNSFQVPLTASDVTNLFGSGSGSLISSPVDLGSGPGGDPATSAIAPNSAGATSDPGKVLSVGYGVSATLFLGAHGVTVGASITANSDNSVTGSVSISPLFGGGGAAYVSTGPVIGVGGAQPSGYTSSTYSHVEGGLGLGTVAALAVDFDKNSFQISPPTSTKIYSPKGGVGGAAYIVPTSQTYNFQFTIPAPPVPQTINYLDLSGTMLPKPPRG